VTAAVNPQLWWYVARASGFVAWGLSIGAVLLGLALATRALGAAPRPAWLLDLHRFVGGLTLAFLGLHLGALVADSYVHFGLADLLVPFAADWMPGPVAWGIVAMWLLVAVEVSSLAMKRLPKRAWRAIHLASYLAVVLSTVHAFTAGTDAGNPVFVWASVGAFAAVAFFLVYRLLLPKRRRRVAARTDAAPRGADPASDLDRVDLVP
jgi:sulfoxide reductase heme-binding subunit YedZ